MSSKDATDGFRREDYMTPPEMAKALGLSKNTVTSWVRTGRLPALVLPSGHYLVHRKYLKLPTR